MTHFPLGILLLPTWLYTALVAKLQSLVPATRELQHLPGLAQETATLLLQCQTREM